MACPLSYLRHGPSVPGALPLDTRHGDRFAITLAEREAARQGFKSLPVQTDEHLLTVCRYVERNALRAGLVDRAQDWRWSSLWRRTAGSDQDRQILSEWPVEVPPNRLAMVNRPQSRAEEEALQKAIRRNAPFGSPVWIQRTANRLGLQSSLRPRGRPRRHNREQVPPR